MEVVWAPWRMTYILGEKAMGCFICQAVEQGVGEESLLLRREEHCAVMLNRYPYISGHLMVVPRRHLSSLDSLQVDEMAALHECLRRSVRAVQESLRPHGINLGMNLGKAAGAGLEEHIHWHIVPRFQGDNNAFNVLSDCRVIPESLVATWQRYLPHFGW